MQPQQFIIYKTRIDNRGRVYIPKELQMRLKLSAGDTVYIVFLDRNEVKIYTERGIKRKFSEI